MEFSVIYWIRNNSPILCYLLLSFTLLSCPQSLCLDSISLSHHCLLVEYVFNRFLHQCIYCLLLLHVTALSVFFPCVPCLPLSSFSLSVTALDSPLILFSFSFSILWAVREERGTRNKPLSWILWDKCDPPCNQASVINCGSNLCAHSLVVKVTAGQDLWKQNPAGLHLFLRARAFTRTRQGTARIWTLSLTPPRG